MTGLLRWLDRLLDDQPPQPGLDPCRAHVHRSASDRGWRWACTCTSWGRADTHGEALTAAHQHITRQETPNV